MEQKIDRELKPLKMFLHFYFYHVRHLHSSVLRLAPLAHPDAAVTTCTGNVSLRLSIINRHGEIQQAHIKWAVQKGLQTTR